MPMPTPYELLFGNYQGPLYYHDEADVDVQIKAHPEYDPVTWNLLYLELDIDDGSNCPFFTLTFHNGKKVKLCIGFVNKLCTTPAPVSAVITPFVNLYGQYTGNLYFHDLNNIPKYIRLHSSFDRSRWNEVYVWLDGDDGSDAPYFKIRFPNGNEDLVCINITRIHLSTLPAPESKPEPEPENDIMAITRRFF